jgi:hypothetical protein
MLRSLSRTGRSSAHIPSVSSLTTASISIKDVSTSAVNQRYLASSSQPKQQPFQPHPCQRQRQRQRIHEGNDEKKDEDYRALPLPQSKPMGLLIAAAVVSIHHSFVKRSFVLHTARAMNASGDALMCMLVIGSCYNRNGAQPKDSCSNITIRYLVFGCQKLCTIWPANVFVVRDRIH